MSQGRHGIKILGLSVLAALGLMAVSVSAAQAGEFKLLGSTFSSLGIASEGFLGTVTKGELLTVSDILLNCTGGTVSGTLKLGGTGSATVNYTGCTVLNNPNCEVYPTELDHIMLTNVGKINASGIGSLILHGGEHYLVVEGKPFTTIYFHNGKLTCLIPLKTEITEKEALYLPTALTSSVVQKALTLTVAQRALLNGTGVGQLNLGIQLKFGKENADLEVPNTTVGSESGIASLHLNSGEPWSAE